MSYSGLFTALKARGLAQAPSIKHYSIWNNQVNRLEDESPKQFDFRKPANFFEFIPGECTSVGNGVQVYENFLIKVHTIHEFFNDKDNGLVDINLNVFDIAQDSHSAYQDFWIKGTDWGISYLNRIETELDSDHDNIYHHVNTYATTYTDNSMSRPLDGYEIDPQLQAVITAEKLDYDIPAITASLSSLNFGNVTVGQSGSLTFTISAENINQQLIIGSQDSRFTLSMDGTNFKTRVELQPTVENEVEELTVHVKFTPVAVGAVAKNINYGVPGVNGSISVTGTGI